jgi:maltose 6'-phosphate phosphatase
MKLLTLNCHSWQEENQLDKLSCLAEVIKKEEYDVIALQEVSQKIDAPYVHDYIRSDNYAWLLAKELGKQGEDYQLVWDLSHIGYEVYEEGIAVLTKHPIIEEHSFFVSQTSNIDYWKTRRIVGATIEYEKELLTFYSCHLGWWDDEEEPFKQQVDTLLAHVHKDNPFFLLGDFNNDAHRQNEGYDYLLSQGLYDTYTLSNKKDSGITVKGNIAGWDDNERALRLDLILSSHAQDIQSSTVVFNGIHYPVVSDHFGVSIEVK